MVYYVQEPVARATPRSTNAISMIGNDHNKNLFNDNVQ
jgi:hypothetical protein